MKKQELYLELIKNVLTYSVWPEPPVPISLFNDSRSPVIRWIVSLISRVLHFWNFILVKNMKYTEKERSEGKIWPLYAHTMVGIKRLDNLQYCIETVLDKDIEGDFIEAGVWRGGTCIFMKAILRAYNINNRKIFVADSFQGLPKPDRSKYPLDENDRFHIHKYLSVKREDVVNNFSLYNLLDDQVIILDGWFNETLPNAPIKELAILRIDADMYGSTMEVLQHLYPKLTKGGFCIIDDYALPGCQKAVNDYRRDNSIGSQVREIDWTGIFWQKD